MEANRFVAKCLLIVSVIQLVYAKNPFHIHQDTLTTTYDKRLGSAKLYISNNNLLQIYVNLTKPLPTNAIVQLRLWHRNPRGKYDAIGIPWSGNGCQFIKTDKFLYENLRRLETTELPEKCPVQAGRYYIKDYDVNQITVPIPLPMGHYKLEVRGVSGKAELIKVQWNGHITPA